MAVKQTYNGQGVTFRELLDLLKECEGIIPDNTPVKVAQDGGGNSDCRCVIADEDSIVLYDWI